MGRLTTHVLDTMQGKPAAGVQIDLYCLDDTRTLVKRVITNADGRCDEALLSAEEMKNADWELVFHVGEYFSAVEKPGPGRPFLGEVPVRFGIGNIDAHYHVPLLVTPWSYTTYRGS